MIDGIGYTEDGQVWMRLVMDIQGQPFHGMLMLNPVFAKEVAQSLVNASDKAAPYIENKGVLQ